MLGGCALAGRDDETPEPVDVDAGEEAVIETVEYDRAEAASHAYHRPDAPVVMPLAMEDAPTSLPPSAALSPPREPKERRSKQTQARKRPVAEADAGADGTVVYSYELGTEHAAAKSESKEGARPAARRAAKPTKDPVAESFLHTYSGGDSYQSRATGTRY